VIERNAPKRVLVVDDEVDVAMLLVEALDSLPEHCEYLMAENAAQALVQARQGPIDLLITDYNMPEVNGLTLIEQLRALSPSMATMLITAHNTSQIKSEAALVGVDELMFKPFRVKDIRRLVQGMLKKIERASPPIAPSEQLQLAMALHLKHVVSDTGARCVFLVSADGNLLEAAGSLVGLDLQVLSTLMAANFAAVTEIARLLGNPRSFEAINHESKDDNIYTCAVGPHHLLVVVYGLSVKPGVVWHYVKKTLEPLAELLAALPIETTADLAPADLSAALDDALFDDPPPAPIVSIPPTATLLPEEFARLSEAVQRGLAKRHPQQAQ
jgi:DNA-binding response OmpR family regulator